MMNVGFHFFLKEVRRCKTQHEPNVIRRKGKKYSSFHPFFVPQVNTAASKWICCSRESSLIIWFKSTRRAVCWLSFRGYRFGSIKELCQLEYRLASQPFSLWQLKLRVSTHRCRPYPIRKLLTYGLACVWRLFLVRCWSLRSSIMRLVQVSRNHFISTSQVVPCLFSLSPFI